MSSSRPLTGRFIKSALNWARVLSMRARGTATRLLLPGLLAGGRSLTMGRNVGLAVYGELIVGDEVTLSDGCAIEVGPTGRLVLGDRVFIGRHAVIVAHEQIEIGSNTLIAEHCTIRDQSHHLDPDQRRQEIAAQGARRALDIGTEREPVSIGAGAWLGAGVRVLKGSRVGDRTVVGANAVVVGELPADVVAAGIPARVIRNV